MSISVRNNVDRLELGDKTIILVGTAHVSRSSVELTEEVIREVRPDSIAVELCDSRYHSLRDPERWKNTDIISVIRSGRTYLLLAQLMLASFQKRIGAKLDIRPGAEMLRALDLAGELNAQTVLADRDIRTTLKRTWHAMGLWTVIKLAASLLKTSSSSHQIDEKEIERMKQTDALEELMGEFAQTLPDVRRTLVDERDQYLAARIRAAPGRTVVAIVGAGHVRGIKEWIGREIDLAVLDAIPPRGVLMRLLGWLIPGLALGLIAYGFFTASAETNIAVVKEWVLINGGAAALGALAALAHPLSILAAFISAPFTTLNPLLASGWFAGLVEAMVRKPRVADLEGVMEDIATMKGLWRNRLTRILLVVAFTNLAGTIGAVVGLQRIATLLF